MAAFSVHQLYRPQLKALSHKSRNTRLVEGLLADAGINVQVRQLSGRLRAGARPYAQIWFAAQQPDNTLFTLEMYASADDIDSRDPALLARHCDTTLGAVALKRIMRDASVPAVRVLAHLPILRINRYRPGHRLLVRLRTGDALDALDLRARAAAPALAADIDAVCAVLELGQEMAPQLYKHLCGVRYRRPHGLYFRSVVATAQGSDAVRSLAHAHARVSASNLPCLRADGADQQCWTSVGVLQRLMHAQPGLVDLGTSLIGTLTASHARHPGDDLGPALDLAGLDGWLFADQQVKLMAPARLWACEAEMVAAGVREALAHAAPARAERLFEDYCVAYARHARPLRARVMRLYRAHRHIAIALGASQRLDPFGDEAARSSLLEALRLTS